MCNVVVVEEVAACVRAWREGMMVYACVCWRGMSPPRSPLLPWRIHRATLMVD